MQSSVNERWKLEESAGPVPADGVEVDVQATSGGSVLLVFLARP
jgi:hypothetical protein